MRVVIGNHVYSTIEEFYKIALSLHITLTRTVVDEKKDRLISALKALGNYPNMYPIARLNEHWRIMGYREFICEDFHFAYEIVDVEGELVVYVVDAVHSLLYH